MNRFISHQVDGWGHVHYLSEEDVTLHEEGKPAEAVCCFNVTLACTSCLYSVADQGHALTMAVFSEGNFLFGNVTLQTLFRNGLSN